MEQDYAIKLLNDLCAITNDSPLPISIKYFVIKDFFNEVQSSYREYYQLIQQQEKVETKEVTVPIDYTEEELKAPKKD